MAQRIPRAVYSPLLLYSLLHLHLLQSGAVHPAAGDSKSEALHPANPYKVSLYLQQIADKVNSDRSLHWRAGMHGRRLNLTQTDFSSSDDGQARDGQARDGQARAGQARVQGHAAVGIRRGTQNMSRRSNPSKRQATYGHTTAPRLDWRERVHLTRPTSQGHCGGCWAFSAMHALADRLAVQSPQSSNVPFSTQHLIECCGAKYKYCSGCEGVSDNAAGFQFITTDYTVLDTCKPYTSHDQTYQLNSCRQRCANGEQLNSNSVGKIRLPAYLRLNSNPQEIIKHLTDGPVIAAFQAYSDLYSYRSGIYKYKSGYFISYHSVEIVGYGNEFGLDYWIIKNSWGPNWVKVAISE